MRKKDGEQKGSVRGSVHWGCYYDTSPDIGTREELYFNIACVCFPWFILLRN